MTPTPLPPPLQALLSTFTAAFTGILFNLNLKLAFRTHPDPRVAALLVPVLHYISRARLRLARLIALLAAGTLPQPGPSRPGRPARNPPSFRLPTARAWLRHAFPFEVGGFASQFAHQLRQPEIAELLAATPQAGRILRPLCRLLGIQAPGEPPPPPPRPYKPPATPPLPPDPPPTEIGTTWPWIIPVSNYRR